MSFAPSPPPRGGPAGPDDLDNLLDYDKDVEDFLKDMPEANGDNPNDTNNVPQPDKDMDEEVKVAKKRKPNPKLDEDRLLSSAGIPKLRHIAKNKLKFKGKGHEFSDISRMLNLYQLWLDDLYPKAKFRDGLTMVEKLGHTRKMQISRRAWIDESKAHLRREDEEARHHIMRDLEGATPDPQQKTSEHQDGPDDDELDALLGQHPSADTSQIPANAAKQQAPGAVNDEPDDDELDALLGEQPTTAAPQASASALPPRNKGPFEDDDGPDDDELNALLNENSGPMQRPSQPVPTKQKGPFEDDDDDEDDELDMLLAEGPQKAESDGKQPNQSTQNADESERQKEADFADDEEAMADMGW